MHVASLCLPIVLLLAPYGAAHSNLANATDTVASWAPWDHSAHEGSYSAAGVVITLMLVAGVVACCCVALRRDPCDAPCDYTGFYGRSRRYPCQCGNRGGARGCRQCSIRDPQQQLFRCVSVDRAQEPPYQDRYQNQPGGPYAVFVGDGDPR